MARNRIRFAGCLLACGVAAAVQAAAPPPSMMLNFRPKQEGVPISTPTEAELPQCKVELVTGPGTASGWLLRDPQGQPLRKFVATKGSSGNVDIWSYYQNGVETYREMDSTSSKRPPDQFRWLGTAGMKWGVDVNHDGHISAWKMISAEEVSQEILMAVAKRDPARLQALLLTEAELKALELPAADADRIRGQLMNAPSKLSALATKLAITDKVHWEHLETGAPQCVPAEATGAKYDIIRHKGGTILYELNGQHSWMQTGELIQVGRVWRVIDGPSEGHYADVQVAESSAGGSQAVEFAEALKPQIEKLKEIDAQAPKDGGSPTAIVRYNLDRAVILEQIVAQVKGPQREQWLRQVADCLSAAAQYAPANDHTAYDKLVALRDRVAKEAPGSVLAGYVVFREMSAEYAGKLANPPKGEDLGKLQDGWRDRLKQFVEAYPTAEDAPDAVMQLGMVSEFVNKETEAKNWYEHLVKHYGKSPMAAKAKGAIDRLDSEGKELKLAGPTLGGSGNFSMTQTLGKVVVVYYWASWNAQSSADFFKLKSLYQSYGSKGLDLVCVNLDNSQSEAISFLQRNPVPGNHLFQAPGGLDSPLAVQYGVMVLPNLFLVGKDGKVVSRTVQMNNLEDEIRKLLDIK